MGKNLRNSVVGGNKNGSRMAGPVTERLTLLEKRYSNVLVHQTYFKILDQWLQCMFGAQLFPKPSDVKVNEDEPDEDNPFYEFHVLAQRISSLEERLENLGYEQPTPINIKSSRGFKIPAPPPPPKPAVKRTYGVAPTTIRRRSNYARASTESQVVRVPVAPRKTIPVVLKASASVPSKTTATTTKVKESSSKSAEDTVKLETEVATESNPNPGDENKPIDTEIKPVGEDDVNKPPTLEQQNPESETTTKTEDVDQEMDVVDGAATAPNDKPELEEMEVDDEEYDEEEDVEQKPIVPTPEELGSETSVGRPRGSRGAKKGSTAPADVITLEDDQPVVTYTARGRRHTLPRRYAEFTGHDNVASILKSQQRAAAANQAAKAKKTAQLEKPKTPSKSKPTTAPKVITPKKPPADGSRPECVYQCIGSVQGKEVDEAGDVILWDTYPNVKVNLQQLISVIFRSNGMSTRLTRKMTTLVFEDQVLANASPFGTKYYQERLPPERLEAMVEFIAASGFDPEYTKKKIYMIVGQVCNEARAGRVRKLLPTTGGQSSEEQTE